MSVKRSALFQRCHVSNWIPIAGRSTSSSRSTASRSDRMIVQSSPPTRLIGSRPTLTPARAASPPISLQTVDDRVPVVARPGEADDRARPEPGQAVQRAADGVDPLVGIGGAFHERQRQDRRHRGDSRRGAQSGRGQRLEGFLVAALGQLDLPDADAVDARGRVCADIFRKRRRQGRDLRDRETRPDAGNPTLARPLRTC